MLSGNRNFEGRINPDVKMNYLASPPLVVAYALAGTMDVDLYTDPLGEDDHGEPVYLKDIWPSSAEIAAASRTRSSRTCSARATARCSTATSAGTALEVPTGDLFAWDERSTYVRQPPFFEDLPREPEPLEDIVDARVLAVLGDSVTTDHISPAGSIKQDGPAAPVPERATTSRPADFNSYGARRGNHEVMMRGTFANIRLRNQLAHGRGGGGNPFLRVA